MRAMSVRSAQLREPVLRIRVGPDSTIAARITSFEGLTLWARATEGLVAGDVYSAEWSGTGRIQLELQAVSLSALGPDGQQSISLQIRRAGSFESAQGLRSFLASRLGITDQPIVLVGAVHWVHFLAGGNIVAEEVRVSGSATEACEPLETGREPTTVDGLRDYLHASNASIGMVINVPCAYLVAGSPYWGRALRINDRFLQVNTSNVVPGLGVRLRCDLTVEIDDIKRPLSIFGSMTQKKDPPQGGLYKATLMIRLNRIDEGQSPGLLLELLERSRRDRPEDA